jgi:hypothetical protein
MTRTAVALALTLGFVGCAYYNSLYNANRAFAEAEDARREGRESTAQAKYAEAIDKAAESYRGSEEGRWADDALYLIGRAHARRGDWPEARAALDAALAVTSDPRVRSGARVFLGAAAVSLGESDAGMRLLEAALNEVEDQATRAEAFLWRARGGFAAGDLEQVWNDLDSAAVGGDRYRVEAALDRLSWAVDAGAPEEAARGAHALTTSRRAAAAKDTVIALVRAAWSRWGADEAGPLLVGVEGAPWPPADRERLLLLRAEIAHARGDTATALADARTVASKLGPSADAGRVLLARWELSALTEPAELEGVRDMLLPAVGSTEAVALLDGIKKVGLMVERSGRRGQELALFGAAELARDILQAPLLARTLFLAYADLEAGSAWEGKALLAALALTPTEAGRTQVQSRLDAIPDNVYAAAPRRRVHRPGASTAGATRDHRRAGRGGGADPGRPGRGGRAHSGQHSHDGGHRATTRRGRFHGAGLSQAGLREDRLHASGQHPAVVGPGLTLRGHARRGYLPTDGGCERTGWASPAPDPAPSCHQ